MLRQQADLRAAVRARLSAFAAGAGVDVERARRRSHVRTVSEAIWCREHQPDAVWFVDALEEGAGGGGVAFGQVQQG